MHWKRIAHAFLLGTGMSVVGVGCAAVDALVSSPAGRVANGSSPERLVAVGRVFENQGRMNQAQAMYRQALKADPGNSIARERMQFIASMNSTRTFSPSELRAQDAIAVADSLKSRKQIEATVSGKATAAKTTASNVALAAAGQAKAVVASKASESFTDDAGWVQIVDTGWELAEMEGTNFVEEGASPLLLVPAAKASSIETVGFEGQMDNSQHSLKVVTAEVSHASVQSEWRPSARSRVTFAELSEWLEAPVENQDNLLRAVQSGEDDGVKALAAAMLTECSLNDASINLVLTQACQSASPLLKVTCRDTLIQRGAIDQDGVDELMVLLTDVDPDIRAQAAASLRNCAGTEWAERCVTGLGLLLDDSQSIIVAVAVSTLGDFGADASGHTGRLEKLMQSDEQVVSEAALVSLNRIRSEITAAHSGHQR